jgi:hypothetical protein
MNRYLQFLLILLFPFYPLWAWLFSIVTNKSIGNFANLIWLPLVIFLLFNKNNRLPKYLIFLILFTVYHLCSVYLFNLLPEDTTWVKYILSDINVYACAVFFVIENTTFDDWFYEKMNRNILIIIVISLLVSLIQIKNQFFFFDLEMDKEMEYVGEGRIFSIYSWLGLNSLGITFPILIAILLSVIDTKRKTFLLVVISAIVVTFLSKARYVMISTIIAFSQLLITSTNTLKRKVYFVLVFLFSIVLLVKAAENYGFNIQEIVQERILEKDSETEMGSAMARVTSYYVFLIKFPEHPWFGVGPKTRDDVVQLLGGEAPLIHVGYLSYLYFYGIIGFFFLFLSLFFLLKSAWYIGKKFNFWGSFYGLITFCVANVTFVYFNLSEMGIIIAVIYLKYYNQKASSEMSEVIAF